MSATAIFVHDFTLKSEGITAEELKLFLDGLCTKWVFQLEKGEETGYLHYQGRVNTKKKKRTSTLRNDFVRFSEKFSPVYLSPTSSSNWKNDFYCVKEETRVEGPWRSDDKFAVKQKMPRDLKNVKSFRPFQQKLMEYAEEYHEREIMYIFDPVGNNGKTIITRYLMYKGIAKELPLCNDATELIQMAYGVKEVSPDTNCFIVDMPRAISKEKLRGFYAGLEKIKSGFAFDKRYKYRDSMFDPPTIIVFSNKLPDLNYLSSDRWNIVTIDNNADLVKYEFDKVVDIVPESDTGSESDSDSD